jgi:N-methylhydantoinase A/oxoprolinase/acetone carboxylase beta subunit
LTPPRPKYRLGFDIGGTFTDFVLIDSASGEAHLEKVLTTPADPSQGVLTGLHSLLARAGLQGHDIDIAIHATTLITNALIERRGARTALVTTAGFRDVLEMGTEVRYDIYDLDLEKPAPLVPRALRFEVSERLDKGGAVLEPLDEGSVRAVAAQLRAAHVEAVAVVFLHSFRNPAHEQRAAEILREEAGDVSVSLSSVVAPEIREFERMSTTVANAYAQPLTRHYVDALERSLQAMGYARRLFLMISSGGIATSGTAREVPIRMVESGPAAGVLAASHWGEAAGLSSLVSFDMGGTTAKIGLVKGGRAAKTNLIEVGRVRRFKKGSGLPVKVPVIELIEIGAGGGSIASVSNLGLLKVGPRSASADPGPACYGRGGREPTVTDANLVLGYLDPNYFLGGAMRLDLEAARQSIAERLAQPLGMSVEEAARGVFEVVNQNMLSAMKVHIAERGEDPRRFYLFAFGGAGPAHAYELARALGMRGVVVPPGAGAASAMGLVTAAVSFDFARSFVTRLDSVAWGEVRAVFEAMASEGMSVLADAGIDPQDPSVSVVHAMDLRHKGQGHEVTVELPREVYLSGDPVAIRDLFYSRYREKYGHAHTNLPAELITCRTVVAAPAPKVAMSEAKRGRSGAPVAKGERPVYFPELRGMVSTPVYDRDTLMAGDEFPGPAIVEERECTIVAGPAARVRIDALGHLFLDLPSAGERAAPAGEHAVHA